MVSASHHLAAESGLAVLRDGGNAIEAMIAAAATITVAYPHMNVLGGDGFWLISEPGKKPVTIDACGAAAAGATIDSYRERGLRAIPSRGPLAALTVAGTVSGWRAARFMWHSGHMVTTASAPEARALAMIFLDSPRATGVWVTLRELPQHSVLNDQSTGSAPRARRRSWFTAITTFSPPILWTFGFHRLLSRPCATATSSPAALPTTKGRC